MLVKIPKDITREPEVLITMVPNKKIKTVNLIQMDQYEKIF